MPTDRAELIRRLERRTKPAICRVTGKKFDAAFPLEALCDEAAAALRAAEAEAAELREALRTIAEGDEPRPLGKPWRQDGKASKLDECTHGERMYETCGVCITEFAAAAIRARGAPQNEGAE